MSYMPPTSSIAFDSFQPEQCNHFKVPDRNHRDSTGDNERCGVHPANRLAANHISRSPDTCIRNNSDRIGTTKARLQIAFFDRIGSMPTKPVSSSSTQPTVSTFCSRCARRSKRRQASCNSAKSALLMVGRATNTRSQPGSTRSHTRRIASLIRRRARFRSTAPPIRRLTVNPQRLNGCAFANQHNTSKGCAALAPVCRTCRKRPLSLSRFRRFTATPLRKTEH